MLYLRRKDHCLRLDAKTGKLLGTISLPDPKAHDFWGYLAYSDGVIYGTAANADHNTVNPYRKHLPGAVTEGKTLFAIDAKTSKILWRHEPRQSYLGAVRPPTIADRQVLYVTNDGHIHSLRAPPGMYDTHEDEPALRDSRHLGW